VIVVIGLGCISGGHLSKSLSCIWLV